MRLAVRSICTWILSLRSTKTPISASSETHVSLPPTRTALTTTSGVVAAT